ncbi:Prp18 domain-containing protein [Coemansia spiralis]|nr:Prp18 domain-containing protein [Coemansia spiralis]
MDFLKEAINQEVKKRKTLYKRARKDDATSDVSNSSSNSTHDKSQQAEASNAKPDPERESRHKKSESQVQGASNNNNGKGASDSKGRKQSRESGNVSSTDANIAEDDEKDQSLSMINTEEIIKRLRARGEPIRLFGETDSQRRKRLRQLELSEERADGQHNEFRRVLAQVEAGAMLEDLKRQAKMNDEEKDKRQKKYEMLLEYDVSGISLELLRTDIDRLHTLLYVYFKRLLYEWDDYLATRPDDERRSAEGKMAAATQRQSSEYLKPLFRNLKTRKVPADVLARITEIARNMLDREYMKANDAYLQLSIGNAPWPLGVTQVGIHARAARENINANKVAHVLNNEVQRKWIQSVKRLMRFAQTKYPPADLAKMVG